MTPEEKIHQLQNLLERVRRNAKAPPAARAPVAVAPPTPAVEEAADDEWADVEVSVGAPVLLEAPEIELELLDEDVVEITVEEEPLAEEAAAAEPAVAAPGRPDLTEIEFGEEVEPPVSSRRAKVAAATMDEALASAAEQMKLGEEAGPEVPIQTPPPESGRQVAPMPPAEQLEAPPVPDDLAEGAEAEAPAEEAAAPAAPAPEQLGETFEFEEAEGPEIEIEVRTEPPPREEAPHELEAPLPRAEVPGAYDEALVPPPEAREEVARHRERVGPAEPAAAAADEGAEVTRRPAIAAAVSPATFSGDAEAFSPSTFLELLDASLKL